MIGFNDLYSVLTAVIPLYDHVLGLCFCKMVEHFLSRPVCRHQRFVATFAVPLLSFEFISRINPYKMDLRFIVADGISKLLTLIVLFSWVMFSKKGSLDRAITVFSLLTLPNTLVMGIPLLKSMYGDDKEYIMIQAVVLPCIIWYTLLLFLFEYREANIVILKNSKGCSNNGNSSQRNAESSKEIQEKHGRSSTRIEDDIFSVILTTPSNPQMLQNNVHRIASAVANAEDDKKEVHLFIWRCRCCTSQGICEQSVEACSRDHEKAENLEQSDMQSAVSAEMFAQILKMVCIKLVRNPNSYASLVGLSWALASCRWGIKKPEILEKSVTILSDAGLGMAMFSLGLFMAAKPKIIACGKRVAAYRLLARFVAGPAVMAVASIAVGLRSTILRVSIVQAALPQGIVPLVFAREYNLHPDVLSTASLTKAKGKGRGGDDPSRLFITNTVKHDML